MAHVSAGGPDERASANASLSVFQCLAVLACYGALCRCCHHLHGVNYEDVECGQSFGGRECVGARPCVSDGEYTGVVTWGGARPGGARPGVWVQLCSAAAALDQTLHHDS